MKSRDTRAFTLLELLTVMAIIGILAAIILPAMRKAKQKAKVTQCASNLIQFSKAIDLYRAENDDNFPDWLSNLYPSYIDSKEVYLCPADYCTQGPPSDYSSHIGADGPKPWWDPHQFERSDDTMYNRNVDRAHPRNCARTRDNNAGKEGTPESKTIDFCSYLYLFGCAPCPLRNYLGKTWNEAMFLEMSQGRSRGIAGRGGHVPVVSCFWHQKHTAGTNSYAPRQKNVINVAVGQKNVFYTNASHDRWWR